jgi:hypothetical protein
MKQFAEVTIGSRAIRIRRFWCEATYGGVIEGEPEVIQACLRAELPKTVRRLCGAQGPLYLVPPPEGNLPQYLCAAELDSVGAAAGHAGHVSFLTVAWLSSSLDVGVPRLVASALASIDWERTAQSSTWEQYL